MFLSLLTENNNTCVIRKIIHSEMQLVEHSLQIYFFFRLKNKYKNQSSSVFLWKRYRLKKMLINITTFMFHAV